MLKKVYKLFALLITAFAGGFFAIVFISWLYKPVTVSPSDAVSIANTYIVFTTIIFVGFTVILGVAGYVFTEQLSASTEANENKILDKLKNRIKDDNDLCLEIMKILIENETVKSHLVDSLESKANQLLTDKVTELELSVGSEFKDMGRDIDGGDANER